MERGAGISLAGGLSLRRARVMDAERLEVARFPAGAVDQLKALGLMSEIITWRLRLFIPTTADGVVILGTLLDRHPVLQRSEEHTSELQSLMRISYAVFCLKKKNTSTCIQNII